MKKIPSSVPFSLLAVLLFAVPCASAVEYEVRSRPLEAGTTLVLVEDHRAPLVGIVVEFPVGTWSPWGWENDVEEAFEIQVYDPAGSLRRRADRLAADLSVNVEERAAHVSASCLRPDVEAVLELIRDLLANRDFDRHELKRRWREDRLAWDASMKEPRFRLEQAGARLLFGADDPRRRELEKPRPFSKDLEHLAAVRDTVVRLPGRAIAFAGDLSWEEAESLATGLLPPALDEPPEGTRPEFGPVASREQLPDETIVEMPRIVQVFFGYGRPSLTYDDPQYPAFRVADHVLGGHFFSRLYKALRHEGGETYGSWTAGGGDVEQDGYAMVTFTRGDNAEVTEGKLREVLRVFHEGGITEEERMDAVSHMLGRRPFSRQSPGQMLRRYLWERRHGLPAGFLDELTDRASRTPLDEVNDLIRRFYDPAQFVMVRVAPK